MLTPSQIAALPRYHEVTLTLAADEERLVPHGTDFLALITATSKTTVRVRFAPESPEAPVREGVVIERLAVERFWLKNTSGAPNTITVAVGSAMIRDNRAVTGSASLDVNIAAIAGGAAIGQQVMAASAPVVIASNQSAVPVRGTDAHDDPVTAAAPSLVAGEARSTERAAVASADAARLVCDLVGKLITLPYANPENFVSGKTAAMTGTGDTAVIGAGGAGVRTYVTALIISNSHATVSTEVIIKDGTTEILRVEARARSASAGPATIVVPLPVPLRLTANTALNAANVTTGSNTYVAAVGYRGA